MENLETIESIMIDYNSVVNAKRYALEDKIENYVSYKNYTNIGLVVTIFMILILSKGIDIPFVISSIVTFFVYAIMHIYFYKATKKIKENLNHKKFYQDIKIEDKWIKSLLETNDWTLEQMIRIGACLKNKKMDYEDLMFLLDKTNEQIFFAQEIERYNSELNRDDKNNNVTNINEFEYLKNLVSFKKMLKRKGIKIAI